MIRGLYTSATTLEQESKRLDVIANNLANIKSSGYKRDEAISEEFNSMLLLKIKGASKTLITKKPDVTQEEDAGTYTVNTQKGFFRVYAPGGMSHSTSLKFRVDDDGYLRTTYRNENHEVINELGYYVHGQKGRIKLELDDDAKQIVKESQSLDGYYNSTRGKLDLKVDSDGNLLYQGQKIDNLLHFQNMNVIGTMSAGTKVNRIMTDYTQSSFEHTEGILDFAISGEGFFTILTPNGERYTRNGEFKLTNDKILVTSEGHRVKGINGEIKIEGDEIAINELGEVIVDEQVVDKIQLVNPERIEYLQKEGSTNFVYEGELVDKGFDGRVIQGYLETSNVDSVHEMVSMMKNFRSYEAAQKIVRTYDDLLANAVNQIAKL